MTREQLIARYPRASESFIRANLSVGDTRKTPLVESNPRHAPLEAKEVQGSTRPRILIRVLSIRKRLLDTDNLCAKYAVDQLRYHQFILNDSPELTTIETTQRKCLKDEAEHTEITIFKA